MKEESNLFQRRNRKLQEKDNNPGFSGYAPFGLPADQASLEIRDPFAAKEIKTKQKEQETGKSKDNRTTRLLKKHKRVAVVAALTLASYGAGKTADRLKDYADAPDSSGITEVVSDPHRVTSYVLKGDHYVPLETSYTPFPPKVENTSITRVDENFVKLTIKLELDGRHYTIDFSYRSDDLNENTKMNIVQGVTDDGVGKVDISWDGPQQRAVAGNTFQEHGKLTLYATKDGILQIIPNDKYPTLYRN